MFYAKARRTSPRMGGFPEHLRPAHRNIGDAVAGKLFTDRFRVQLAENPAISVSKASGCNHATDA